MKKDLRLGTSLLNTEGENLEVNSAEQATEIALSFIKKSYSYTRPGKAAREGDLWIVEIDVGLLQTKIAQVKVDGKTGAITEFSVPTT